MKVWCVRNRDGWCATRMDTLPEAGVGFTRTECNRTVSVPCDIAYREPTCEACKEAMEKK